VSALVVFGATGALGRQIVGYALDHGHHVTAVARNPSAMGEQHDRLTLLRGDVLAPATLGPAVAGQAAVILAIGGSNAARDRRTPSSTCSEGTRNVLEAMAAHDVSRVVAVSSWGVGDSLPRAPLFYRLVIFPLVIGGELIDKARQEEVLRNSDADWTIVRPSRLTGEPARHRMAVAERLRYSPRASISRADVARFMVDGVGDQRLFGRTVEISDHARATQD
jgi:nucleoside-diphosphate-sugar epimerase